MRWSFVFLWPLKRAILLQPILTGMNLIHCFMTDGKSVHAHSTDLWSFESGGFYNLQLMWKQIDRQTPKVRLTWGFSPLVTNGVHMRSVSLGEVFVPTDRLWSGLHFFFSWVSQWKWNLGNVSKPQYFKSSCAFQTCGAPLFLFFLFKSEAVLWGACNVFVIIQTSNAI